MNEDIYFAIPLVIWGIAVYYRESGMEEVVIPRTVLEHRLKIAKKNLTKAEKGRSLISGLVWIMLLSTIYFVGGPEQFGYDSVLGQFGFPLSLMTLVLLGLYRFLDDFSEKAEFEQIEKLLRDKKSKERAKKIKERKAEKARAKEERVATEKAEYKAEQIEKAMNLKKEGGIENLEKALEILNDYE